MVAHLSGKMHSPRLRIGVDVGGTFTDLVVVREDGRAEVFKVPSVPNDPSVGVIAAVNAAASGLGLTVLEFLGRCEAFVHGSTIATNILLERTGARVGMFSTAGFRDSIAIRRGLRPNPWDHRTPFTEPLVPRHLRIGVRGRLDAEGAELSPLSEEDVEIGLGIFSDHGVEAIAVCFINSYVDGRHERAAERVIRLLGCSLPVSLSSNLAPIIGEYERGSTAVIDAHIRARVVTYLKALETKLKEFGLPQDILIIQSNGGAVSVDRVARAPVGMCLSGPAAGVGAMRYFGELCATDDLITMEIGGTSCDVTMMRGGRSQLVDLYAIGGFHVAQPAVEIHTVGAGGGTIARIDGAGLLICGPQGAGADPGPACYGRGGLDATTTDALVVLGRMRAGEIANGAINLNPTLAREAVEAKVARPLGLSEEEAAAGIISMLEQNLLHAVEEISVKRGINPAGFMLVAAGGAGPMFGASVARMLGCSRVYVPRHAGAFCALGMVYSDLRLDFVRVLDLHLDAQGVDALQGALAELKAEAADALAREGRETASVLLEMELDLTYQGQLRPLRVPWVPGQDSPANIKARFESEHSRTYGHLKPITPIRIAALRIIGLIPAVRLAEARPETSTKPAFPSTQRRVFVGYGAGSLDIPVYDGHELGPGHRLTGPLIVEEATTTIFANCGDVLAVDLAGNYMIEIGVTDDQHRR